MTPTITRTSTGNYAAEGDGIRRLASSMGDAAAAWAKARNNQARKIERKAAEARRIAEAAMPKVESRTIPHFKPLKLTSPLFALNAARARAAQPPMMGMMSNGRGWVEGGSSR